MSRRVLVSLVTSITFVAALLPTGAAADPSKGQCIEANTNGQELRRAGKLSTGKGDALKRELLQFEERLTPAGQFTFRGRGTTHDDYVALLLTRALADADPGLPLSPYRRSLPRGMGQFPILPY
jgi:hypothetical protein